MARKGKMSILKRQRERKKAEKAALKRELRGQRTSAPTQVATPDDLAGYGLAEEPEPEPKAGQD